MARFFTSRGIFVGLASLPHAVRSLWQPVLRRSFNIYPELPWIPFSAIRELERILRPTSIVYEIGAGMSTLWFSARAGKVTSVESGKNWHAKLAKILADRGITNVELKLEWQADRISALPGAAPHSLDLLVVDGGPRDECLAAGFDRVKDHGHIYLDNWDVRSFWARADAFLESRGAEIAFQRNFVDYVPGNFAVNEGLLIGKKPRAGRR